MQYDPRYKYLNFEVDEYTILNENGIFVQMVMLPEYNYQVPSAIQVK